MQSVRVKSELLFLPKGLKCRNVLSVFLLIPIETSYKEATKKLKKEGEGGKSFHLGQIIYAILFHIITETLRIEVKIRILISITEIDGYHRHFRVAKFEYD